MLGRIVSALGVLAGICSGCGGTPATKPAAEPTIEAQWLRFPPPAVVPPIELEWLDDEEGDMERAATCTWAVIRLPGTLTLHGDRGPVTAGISTPVQLPPGTYAAHYDPASGGALVIRGVELLGPEPIDVFITISIPQHDPLQPLLDGYLASIAVDDEEEYGEGIPVHVEEFTKSLMLDCETCTQAQRQAPHEVPAQLARETMGLPSLEQKAWHEWAGAVRKLGFQISIGEKLSAEDVIGYLDEHARLETAPLILPVRTADMVNAPGARRAWKRLKPWERTLWQAYVPRYGQSADVTDGKAQEIHITPEVRLRMAARMLPEHVMPDLRGAMQALADTPVFTRAAAQGIWSYAVSVRGPPRPLSVSNARLVSLGLISLAGFEASKVVAVMDAWKALGSEAGGATTFEQLQRAAGRFGARLDDTGLRILVALAMAPGSVPVAPFNATMTVTCWRGKKQLGQWQGSVAAQGNVPVEYRGRVSNGRVTWENDFGPAVASVRVAGNQKNSEGILLEEWLRRYPNANRITIVVSPDSGHGTGDGGDGTGDGGDGWNDGSDAENQRSDPDPRQEAEIAAFERELGISADGDDGGCDAEDGVGSESSGAPAQSTQKTGQQRNGRFGVQGGTGPGGDDARLRGGKHGRGAQTVQQGGVDSETGTLTGEQGGDAKGARGGHGQRGARGARGATALWGGLVGVPAAIRPLVELAIAVSDANITGAGKGLIKQWLKDTNLVFLSAAKARIKLASEARHAAIKELRIAQAKLNQTDAFTKLSKAEQAQILRITYWEQQRRFFEGAQEAAKLEQQQLRQALAKTTNRVKQKKLKKQLAQAELLDEVAEVKPIAGRLPINHEYAGKEFPRELLPEEYRVLGVRFKKSGHPDFEQHALVLPAGTKHVQIKYTGARTPDYDAGYRAAGFAKRPKNYTWHHLEDGEHMMLVPTALHDSVRHTGGTAVYKHVTGVLKYGR